MTRVAVDTPAWADDLNADLDGIEALAQGAADAVALKAPLASPVLTGNPTAPTPGTSDNDTSIATTAFVHAVVAALIAAAPGALDTLDELAAAMGDDANFATTVTNALALKAPLASPGFTGNPTAPTASPGDNDTSIATTAFVKAAVDVVMAITDLKSDKVRALNSQTGTSYTLVVADADKNIDIFNAATHTLTVPTNTAQPIPQGSVIPVYRRGAGDVVVAPADGTVTINAPGGNLGLPQRYDVGYLWKWGTNTWAWIVNPDLAGYATDSDLASAIAGLAAVAASGDYDDLSNTPTLPISRSDEVASPITLTTVTPTDLTLLNALGVGTYDIECLISFTGDSTDDSKFRLLFSGTATCMLKIVASRTAWAGSAATGMSIEEGAQKLGVQTTFDTTVTAIGSAANPGLIHWCGRVTVTVAGNLTVNGGKSADANATDTVVAAGSYLSAVQVLTTP